MNKRDAAAFLIVGGLGCAGFAYYNLTQGDHYALLFNSLTAVWCIAMGIQLWNR